MGLQSLLTSFGRWLQRVVLLTIALTIASPFTAVDIFKPRTVSAATGSGGTVSQIEVGGIPYRVHVFNGSGL